MFCLTVGSLTSTLAACSSDEKPPRSASYSDGTPTAPATPYRDLPGDGSQEEAEPPVPPTRDRPTPNSDNVQAGSEGIFGGSGANGDAGASEPEADAGSDAGADAGG